MVRSAFALVALLALAAPAAAADWEISLYGGSQGAPDSRVTGTDPGGVGNFDFDADWQGRSFDNPPHWGLRATWWRDQNLGFGVEINHTKVYASADTLAASGFSRLELSDGLNIATANVMYRWPDAARRWTPYVGAGLGVAVPHVEVTSPGGTVFEYQLSGPAAMAVAGVSYSLSDRWSVFTEYKGTYSVNTMDLGSGGTMKTDIMTNALNLGVSLNF